MARKSLNASLESQVSRSNPFFSSLGRAVIYFGRRQREGGELGRV